MCVSVCVCSCMWCVCACVCARASATLKLSISTHHEERKQLYLQHLVFVTPLLLPAAIAAGSTKVRQIPDAVETVVCAPDDGWKYHPKHVEQFPDKINCVTLYLFGYILEYSYNARTHER
jgi:hypothetical protein